MFVRSDYLKVEHLINDTYQLVNHDPDALYNPLYQGTKEECEEKAMELLVNALKEALA